MKIVKNALKRANFGGGGMMPLRVLALLPCLAVTAWTAEVALEGETEVASGTTYAPETVLSGSGSLRVTNGAQLQFKGGTFANTFSGGIVVDSGILKAANGVSGTPFGTGRIQLTGTGDSACRIDTGALTVANAVEIVGDSTAASPAFDQSEYGPSVFSSRVQASGDVFISSSFAASGKNNWMDISTYKFPAGLSADGKTVAAACHAQVEISGPLTCATLKGLFKPGSAASAQNGLLGGFLLSSAANEIDAIILDSQYLKCGANGALNGPSLRFEGRHACCGPDAYAANETGYLQLNNSGSGAWTQTLRWIESDARPRETAVGYRVVNKSSAFATLVIAGEADKTATASVALDGAINLVIDSKAPDTFRQEFQTRANTMSGSISVKGGTLALNGTVTFANVTQVAVTGTGALEIGAGASPFVANAVDLTLGKDARLIVPTGVTLKFKTLTVSGELLAAGTYSSADLTQISGGSVESISGATTVVTPITWNGSVDTDATKGVNWGLSDDTLSFGTYTYHPTFATVGSSAIFPSGAVRFVAVDFDAPTGFTVGGAADTRFLVLGDVTVAAADTARTYTFEKPLAFAADPSVAVGEGALLDFAEGIETAGAVTKAGVGSARLGGQSQVNGTLTVSGGALRVAGTVDGTGALAVDSEKGATLVLDKAVVNVPVSKLGTTSVVNPATIQSEAGTTNVLGGKLTVKASFLFSGMGTTILTGGAEFLNKAMLNSGEVVFRTNPVYLLWGGLYAQGPSARYTFEVGGSTLGDKGYSATLSMTQGGTVELKADNAIANATVEIGLGTLALNGTVQSVRELSSAVNSGGAFVAGSVVGEAGAKLTVQGSAQRTVYVGDFGGRVSLDYAGGSGGELCISNTTVTSVGEVSVSSGTLAFTDATWPNATRVSVSGTGVLKLGKSQALGSKRAALYIRDAGQVEIPAGTRQKFAVAYLWDETTESYRPATREQIVGHVTGSGNLRVGSEGVMLILR